MATKNDPRCNHDLDAPLEACTLFTHSEDVFFCEHCDGVFVGMPPTPRSGLRWDEGVLREMRRTIAALGDLPAAKPSAN